MKRIRTAMPPTQPIVMPTTRTSLDPRDWGVGVERGRSDVVGGRRVGASVATTSFIEFVEELDCELDCELDVDVDIEVDVDVDVEVDVKVEVEVTD